MLVPPPFAREVSLVPEHAVSEGRNRRLAGTDQAGLVGEDDNLHSASQGQLRVASFGLTAFATVADQLHALARFRTGNGRYDLDLPLTRAWAEPATRALKPLLARRESRSADSWRCVAGSVTPRRAAH
jgi:hypothetical protein